MWLQDEAQYGAMASANCECLWPKQLLQELKLIVIKKMLLVCCNQVVMHSASNPVLNRTKHIKTSCHFIKENIEVIYHYSTCQIK